jgi:hypothetical protein
VAVTAPELKVVPLVLFQNATESTTDVRGPSMNEVGEEFKVVVLPVSSWKIRSVPDTYKIPPEGSVPTGTTPTSSIKTTF